jgi:UDP-GlcNAc:undecaprenyl-phosphate GlcNAc-1-phosphate transferase
MTFFLSLFILSAFVFLFFLHLYFYRTSKYYNIHKVNQKGVRWNSQSKPIAGGITFFFSFIFAVTFFLMTQDLQKNLVSSEYLYISIALIFAFFTGLADDMLSMAPLFKLIIQGVCAALLIYSGLYIHLFGNNWLNYALTMFWYIGIMNSINMLDNMDAISTIVSISILSGFIALNALFYYNLFELMILISLTIALLTFLYYNWSPAKMYMGDNGSLFLGLFLAIFGVKYLWTPYSPILFPFAAPAKPVLLISLFFLVPLTDTTTVTINRLLNKRSPFVGGKDHTTHALFSRGLSEKLIALLLFFTNLAGISFALSFFVVKTPSVGLIVISILFCTFVALFLYANAVRSNKQNKA